MAGFTLSETLRMLTPPMVARMLTHPYRTAYHVTRFTRPDLRGPAFWLEVQREAWKKPTSPARPSTLAFTRMGNIARMEQDGENSIRVKTENGAFKMVALADDLIHLRFRPDGQFPALFSYSVHKSPDQWTGVKFEAQETSEAVTCQTGAMGIVIEKKDSRMIVKEPGGQELFRGAAGASYSAAGQIGWEADFGDKTAFYGLGEKTASLNLAGGRFEMWNTDPAVYDPGDDPIYMSVPMLLTLNNGHSVGLFFDNTHRSWLDLGATLPGRLSYVSASGELCFYLMVGKPESILERYTELTGRISMPPLWALGFQQSRWSYYPQERVLEIARGFRERHLPCDAIHLDIHYMDGYRSFTWDKKRYPDPRGMIEKLHTQGFKAVSIINPGIKISPGYEAYEDGLKRDAFLKYPDGARFIGPVWPGDCHFPDFSDPAVREWWGGLYEGLIEDGLDSFWNDMNEPALITGRSGETIGEMIQHSKEGQGASHAEIHNVYGMLMVRASAEGLRRLRPDRRTFILSRSGWAGLQRYAMHWTADNRGTWEHLRLSIPMILNLGLSGIAFTGADVGGFTGSPGGELFARWMELGAFLPFYRVHCMQEAPPQEPWAFGPEIEAISRKYLDLRYRLLPYIYTATRRAAMTGAPIARPMSFVCPDDPRTYNLDDQYFFGDSLLVAPILEEGATRRRVYLSAGDWHDFWTGHKFAGGQFVDVYAPLDALPLFVQSGAVIPLWPAQEYVGQRPIDTLTLRAYPGNKERVSILYEDNGETPDYDNSKNHRVSEFILRQNGVKHRITQGNYKPSYSRIRVDLFGLGAEPKDVAVTGGQLIGVERDQVPGVWTIAVETMGAFDLSFGAG